MGNKKQTIAGVLLIIVSTLCYYIPVLIAGLSEFSEETTSNEFYNYYKWTTAGAMLLISVYSFYLFFSINPKLIILKIASGWLLIAESVSFIIHVVDKFYRFQALNTHQIAINLILFTIFCAFFLKQALFKQKSETFRHNRTYIISFLPRDTIAIINYIIRHEGHKAIYQAGFIYKFRKKTRKIEKITANSRFLSEKGTIFKEIPEIINPDRLINKDFKIFRYNCNHMIKDAQA